MARIEVSPELVVVGALFRGAAQGVQIMDASFDHVRGTVVFVIEGYSVPLCEEVTAALTVERRTVQFNVVKP